MISNNQSHMAVVRIFVYKIQIYKYQKRNGNKTSHNAPILTDNKYVLNPGVCSASHMKIPNEIFLPGCFG